MKNNIVFLREDELKLREDRLEQIAEKLKGRRFFAISFLEGDEEDYYEHHCCQMTDEEIVFLCELMKNKIMQEYVVNETI